MVVYKFLFKIFDMLDSIIVTICFDAQVDPSLASESLLKLTLEVLLLYLLEIQ